MNKESSVLSKEFQENANHASSQVSKLKNTRVWVKSTHLKLPHHR